MHLVNLCKRGTFKAESYLPWLQSPHPEATLQGRRLLPRLIPGQSGPSPCTAQPHCAREPLAAFLKCNQWRWVSFASPENNTKEDFNPNSQLPTPWTSDLKREQDVVNTGEDSTGWFSQKRARTFLSCPSPSSHWIPLHVTCGHRHWFSACKLATVRPSKVTSLCLKVKVV